MLENKEEKEQQQQKQNVFVVGAFIPSTNII